MSWWFNDGNNGSHQDLPPIRLKAGTPVGQVTSSGQYNIAATLLINAGNITTTVGIRPEVNLMVAVVPAAKVERAAVLAEIGPTRSKGQL